MTADSSIDDGGRRRRAGRAAIVLAAILVPQIALYFPALFGEQIALPVNLLCERLSGGVKADSAAMNYALWDPLWQYEPTRQFVGRELRAGRFPLWNPMIFGGVPLFTNTGSPFQWLYYAWPDPLVLGWMILLKSLVAGSGAYLFFRRSLNVSFWAAAFGAAVYPLSAFLVLWHYYVISSACVWLPWLLLFVEGTARRPFGFGFLGVALTTAAVMLEGLGAPWPHLLLASGLYFLWSLADQYGLRRMFGPSAWRAMISVSAAWALGAALTMPQNLPAADYLRSSNRVAERAQGAVEERPAGWRAWEELVFPYHFGDTTTDSYYFPRQGTRLEGAPSGYAGFLCTLVLAPLAFCDSRRNSRNWLWLAWGIFGMAFHANLPVFAELFQVFPFNYLRNNRFTLYTGWSIVALAVTGLDGLQRNPRLWRAWCWGVVGLIALAALHALYGLLELREYLEAQRMPVAARWFAATYLREVIVGVAALIAWWFIRRRAIAGWPAVLLCAAAVGELTINSWNANPMGDRRCYFPATPMTKSLSESESGRVSLGAYLAPNMGMMYGLSEIRGYDGADPARLVQLLRAADPNFKVVASYMATQQFDPPRSPLMDLLGIRYVFHPGPVPPGMTPIARDRFGWIEERPEVLPRLFVPSRTIAVDDAKCLEIVCSSEFAPRDLACVAADEKAAESDGARGSAEIIEEHPMRVVARAKMQTPGLLLLADSWDPGWKVFVNGKESSMLRVNYLLRGVSLPAEDCKVEFVFAPASFTRGIWLCLSSACCLLIWSVATGRRARLSREKTASGAIGAA